MSTGDKALLTTLTAFTIAVYLAAVAVCYFRNAGREGQPTSCIFAPRSSD